MMWITLNFLSENVDIKDFPKMEGYKGIYLSELYGNVYICTYDWMNKYGLGNVREMKLIDILKSEDYQKLLSCNRKCFVHGDVHDFCKHCPRPYQNIDNMTEGVK